VSTELGEAFYEELLWVHGMLRQELELVRSLAARVADGLSAEELRIEVAALKANGPLWALKVNCLHYCRFVHGHHRLEDVALFPALRAADPEIAPVVDRLEADHRVVAAQLDEIEAAVAGSDQARVIAALDALADHLLEHLAFEEESIGPTLRRMDRHPLWS
jgi:Hemerythrin HHE cation binding domain